MKIDVDCKQMSRLISAARDGRLRPGDSARRQLHLLMCATCRNVEEQMGFLRRAMRGIERHDEQRHDEPPPP
jgi:predicted anti-sigma-YlaC factor YlaD